MMEQVTEEDHRILLSMVESPFDFFEIEMELFFRDTPVMVEPMFRITPKSFDTVDVIAPLGSSAFFANYDVVSMNIQEGICMPVIRIEKASRSGMRYHQRDQIFAASIGNGKGQNFPISLVDTEYHVFAGGSPTTFPRCFPTEKRLIQLNFTREKRQIFERFLINGLPKDMIPSLNRFRIKRNLKSQPICRYTQAKEFQKSSFPVWGNSRGIPSCYFKLSGETTLAAPLLSGGKMPEFRAVAARTFPHCSIILAPNPLSKN